MHGHGKKMRRSLRFVITFILALCAIVASSCGFFGSGQKDSAPDAGKTAVTEQKSAESEKAADKEDKKDEKDAKDAKEGMHDLTGDAAAVHKTVDGALSSLSGWDITTGEAKTVDTKNADGAAWRITRRHIRAVAPEGGDLKKAARQIRESLSGSARELSDKEGARDGYDYLRLDIGLKESAVPGGGLMTDTIMLLAKAAPREKKTEPAVHVSGGRLAVVVDDCGYDNDALRKLLSTGLPFTYAILPGRSGSAEALSLIKGAGRTAMLHLPMEPMDQSQMSEGSNTILVSQTAQQKTQLAERLIASVPGISGVNNHQGSRATSDKATMEAVLKVLKQKGLFFVDSRTASSSVALDTARQMGIRSGSNSRFLDNSNSPDDIYDAIKNAIKRAEGTDMIVICHSRPGTARAWAEHLNEIKKSGITFVPVTQLLR